ncbi:MAG: hypothetical protein IPP56_16465 [Bacteroidetes bacterium]|nr:hypothetical protein [Bacteroidota bacterium]MBK9801240.1 hypothetical protein [Bacteroidota bacterium]
MKRLIIVCLFFHLSLLVKSQQYLTSEIRLKGDSIMRKILGDTIFSNNSIYDSTSRYFYWRKGVCLGGTLTKEIKTKGKFSNAFISYYLSIPYPSCKPYSLMKFNVTLILNKNLFLEKAPELGFIPDSYWKNIECEIIDKEVAISLARQQNLKPGIDSLKTSIYYSLEKKKLVWSVSHILSEETKIAFKTVPYKVSTVEEIIIDAASGNVISQRIYQLSPMY